MSKKIISIDISYKFINTLKSVNWKQFMPDDNEEYVIDELNCEGNNLYSLDGCPDVKRLKCAKNYITTLEGCPLNMKEIDCSENMITINDTYLYLTQKINDKEKEIEEQKKYISDQQNHIDMLNTYINNQRINQIKLIEIVGNFLNNIHQ